MERASKKLFGRWVSIGRGVLGLIPQVRRLESPGWEPPPGLRFRQVVVLETAVSVTVEMS